MSASTFYLRGLSKTEQRHYSVEDCFQHIPLSAQELHKNVRSLGAAILKDPIVFWPSHQQLHMGDRNPM